MKSQVAVQDCGWVNGWMGGWVNCKVKTPMDTDRLIELESLLRTAAIDQRKAALDELAGYSAELAVPLLERLAAGPRFFESSVCGYGFGWPSHSGLLPNPGRSVRARD